MRAWVGYSELPDSAAAGKQAAEGAVGKGLGPCDISLLFCTSRHNQKILREAVSSVLGEAVPIYGGGAVGVITNNYYGYAGDQVGVACLWLDGARCDVLTDGGLAESEEDTGFRLGEKLARIGVTPESNVMLFYDALSRDGAGSVRMLMATLLLKGLKNALGFLPDLTGAGFMADHVCSTTGQYIGEDIGKDYAMALSFSGDVRIDSVFMHGSRPASPYYTVTKAEGPVILEIDGKPAISFIDEILGSSVKPEQYPFFLLFGVNCGESCDGDCESRYATRLCLDIDLKRGGIVMFEPDMEEGTEFQLMLRSIDLDYMKPKIDSLFRKLDGREPVFAVYIDCAGRCAGYAGDDLEDALVLQRVVAGRVPLLGLYTGVEIASVCGCPRALDWAGVFCLFSQSGKTTAETADANAAARQTETSAVPQAGTSASPQDRTAATLQGRIAATLQDRTAATLLTPEVIRDLCERNAAKALSLTASSMMIRYELELKRRGFSLISELTVFLRQTDRSEDMFVRAAQRINAALNMQKTLLLVPDRDGMFSPVVLQGYTPEEKRGVHAVKIPAELLRAEPVIVTAKDSPERFADLRRECNLPFFIASAVFLQGKVRALLLTGRMAEQPPYFSRLGHSDMETVCAITELLGSVLARRRLYDVTIKAETDNLTGLWNRDTFRRKVESYLSSDEISAGAFMMIDIDYFKSVNDNYGHIAGDNVLAGCAGAMRHVLRDTDIIGRQGGDEFVVFCSGIKDGAPAEKKAEQIREAWSTVIPDGAEKHITASIGISIYPQHGVTFQELYNNADTALYRAKERGRDRFVMFQGVNPLDPVRGAPPPQPPL